MTALAVAPTLEFTTASARELGFYDGQTALALFTTTGHITIPDARVHGINTPRARSAYHQGWILGRLGAETYEPRCPRCHRRHTP